MTEEKKKYEKPETEVISFQLEQNLLQSSGVNPSDFPYTGDPL